MTTPAAFRQADLERVFRAAKKTGSSVQVDIRSLVVTVIPAIHSEMTVDDARGNAGLLSGGNFAPDGKENWDED